MKLPRFPYKSPYGQFSDDGQSFIITRPDTPRPWINVMCTGAYGVAMSQTGSGYSWLNNAFHNKLTRWNQDPLRDEGGRCIYIRDDKTGEFWSVGWKPLRPAFDSYQCVHGVGFTIITSQIHGVQCQWMVFVPHEEPLEIWRLRVRNLTKKPRTLSVWTYLEWNRGESPDRPLEDQRALIETAFQDGNRVVMARRRTSSNKSAKGLGNQTVWHGINLPTRALCADRAAFLGPYGSLESPEALRQGRYVGKTTHKWDDAVASLCVPINLKPGEERSMLMTVGIADSESQALAKAKQFQDFSQVDHAWNRTEMFWDKYLSTFRVKSPDRAFDLMTNSWLRYQALSSGIWGRASYDRLVGTYGFREQLQNSQMFLSLDSEKAKEQVLQLATHQFADGSVPHRWHPSAKEEASSRYADDPLWLPASIVDYVKESGHWSFLSENAPFARQSGTNGSASVYDHGVKAVELSLGRLGPRGLPMMGDGDWLGGLSCADGKGESVWAGCLLHSVLVQWADMIERAVVHGVLSSREKTRALRYKKAAQKLRQDINRHAWDGEWYARAACDDGSSVGSRKNKEGRLYLDSQVSAVLHGVVDSSGRLKTLLKSIEKTLYSPFGPLFLNPPYTAPEERIGSLTRCAPGTQANGGVLVAAAVWALRMECFLGRAAKAWELYRSLCPVYRSTQDAKAYACEPYVAVETVDGPASATPGRGRTSWYTSSAAELFRASTEAILGIRADWEGLRVRPCLPPDWKQAQAVRVFRGATYQIQILRDLKLSPGTQVILFNDQKLAGDVLPLAPGRTCQVVVAVGPAAAGTNGYAAHPPAAKAALPRLALAAAGKA